MKKADTKQKKTETVEDDTGRSETDEWKAKYLRVLADYQNLDRRTDERVANVRKYASEAVLKHILPVVDTFDKVREHIKDHGLDLAHKELMQVLEGEGVSRIEVSGREFDPSYMDCIEVVPGQENVVLEEVLPGYMLRDKVLRVAKVKVGKKGG